MKFLADECCDAGLVEALRADDHDVLYAQESLGGGVDDDILAVAYSQDRILLTRIRILENSSTGSGGRRGALFCRASMWLNASLSCHGFEY